MQAAGANSGLVFALGRLRSSGVAPVGICLRRDLGRGHCPCSDDLGSISIRVIQQGSGPATALLSSYSGVPCARRVGESADVTPEAGRKRALAIRIRWTSPKTANHRRQFATGRTPHTLDVVLPWRYCPVPRALLVPTSNRYPRHVIAGPSDGFFVFDELVVDRR